MFLASKVFSTSLMACLAGAVTLAIANPIAALGDQSVRLSWEDFAKDPQKVASLRKAIAVMKARNSADHASVDYRKSWEYWANIHGYFGPQSPFGTVASNRNRVSANNQHYFDGISDMTPPDQVASDVWANCQHGTPWFFAWHRLFLLYLEKQLQDAASDPTLRLPYWDYTNSAEVKMPTAFTEPTYTDTAGVTQPNPLYEPRRAPGWQQGRASLDANSTNIDSALKDQSFSSYQSNIERNIHGYVHCSVSVSCPVPDMGSVPYSANDPIFWIHHANIDRLWSCWSSNASHHNPNDQNFLNKSFRFVSAGGQEVTNKVGDLFAGTLVDYKYEKEENCGRSVAVAFDNESLSTVKGTDVTVEKFNELLAQPKSLNVPTEPVTLAAATTKVKVELRTNDDVKTLSNLALDSSSTKPTKTQLILSGITFDAPPGVQFYVYLEDSADSNRREYAGTVNFFGAEPGSPLHDHESGSAEQGLTREFDVTQALRSLSGSKKGLSNVTVAFVATSGRSGDTETAEISSDAHLTVKSIDFQVSAVK
jgi:hypothetical protein